MRIFQKRTHDKCVFCSPKEEQEIELSTSKNMCSRLERAIVYEAIAN